MANQGTVADTRPKSSSGKRIGRPKTRHEKLKSVSTRCPNPVYVYLKGITPFRYSSLTEMFFDMLSRFMTEKPWEHGLYWRKPKTTISHAGATTGATGWEQVNIFLEPAKADEIKKMAAQYDVSVATFCYTAIYWWVTYVFPPAQLKLTR